jgi:3-oxoacyl-[acyl-carrier protein] reductase
MVNVDLKGRAALVTGGSRGLGRAAALLLAEAGCDIALGYRQDKDAAEEAADRCREFGVRAFAFKADLAVPAEVQSLVRRAARQLGRLDILVANAGVWKETPIETLSEEALAETLEVNLRGVFRCCREVVPLMKAQGSGRVILVSSTAGQRGEPLHSVYAASKGAVQSLAKSLAAELAPDNILVNCIAPGWFATDMTRPTLDSPAERQKVLATIPLGRVGEPREFAAAVLFLASDLSTFVTGEVLNVNGGAVLCG